MTPELETKLVKRYPEVFKHAGGDPAETCMAWGIAVGDGWFDLIDVLCNGFYGPLRNAQRELDYLQKNAGKQKYDGTLIDADMIAAQQAKVDEALAQIPVAAQVKEKFGGLRFYADGGTPAHQATINFAEAMSERTCEVCGARGMLYPIGWVRALCPDHADAEHGLKAVALRAKQEQQDD